MTESETEHEWSPPEPLALTGPRRIAKLMGLSKWQSVTAIELVEHVERGLPLTAVERLAKLVAREDPRVLYALVSRSTIARIRKKPKQLLTKEVSERAYAIARVFGTALDVWNGDDDAAVRFLNRPHPLLDGRTPLDVATESTAGADLVVEILGAGQAGVAV